MYGVAGKLLALKMSWAFAFLFLLFAGVSLNGLGEGRGHEGSEGWSWGKSREGGQGKRYLDRGSHYGISEKPGTREIPKNPKDDPR